jgi:hypothetical protein
MHGMSDMKYIIKFHELHIKDTLSFKESILPYLLLYAMLTGYSAGINLSVSFVIMLHSKSSVSRKGGGTIVRVTRHLSTNGTLF